MLRLQVLHRTFYNFAADVQLGPHRLRLRPRDRRDLQIQSFSLEITPPAVLRWSRDEFDNTVATASFDLPTRQLAISAEVVICREGIDPFDFLVDAYALDYPFYFEPDTWASLQPFVVQQDDSVSIRAIRLWLGNIWQPGQPIQTYELLWRLCSNIHATLAYRQREEPGVQSAAETLFRGSGSCRDFARLMMETARYLGLPARFVSGYLHATNAPWDFGATHAWVDVYLPGAGWTGFDPTLGELAGNKHIPVAVARLADEVPPISGSFFGAGTTDMSVGVWVTELQAQGAKADAAAKPVLNSSR